MDPVYQRVLTSQTLTPGSISWCDSAKYIRNTQNKSKGSKQKVVEYFLSLFLGLFHARKTCFPFANNASEHSTAVYFTFMTTTWNMLGHMDLWHSDAIAQSCSLTASVSVLTPCATNPHQSTRCHHQLNRLVAWVSRSRLHSQTNRRNYAIAMSWVLYNYPI